MSKRVLATGVCVLAFAMVAYLAGCSKKDDHSGHDHSAQAHDHDHDLDHTAEKVVEATGEQTLCPVMGNPINKDVFVEYKGKKVYFCCPGCDEKFTADPEKYLDKLPQFK